MSAPRKMHPSDNKLIRKKFKFLSIFTALTHGTNRLLMTVPFLALSTILWFFSVPEQRSLSRLEADLQAAQAKLDHTESLKDDLQQILRCIKEDPEYLEVLARDRVPWHKPEEVIFTIER